MSVISKGESERLEREFSKKMVDDVELVIFTQEVPCVYCRETVEVVNETCEATGVMSEDLSIRHVVEALAQKEPVQPR